MENKNIYFQKKQLKNDGELLVKNLPFKKGQTVEVILLSDTDESSTQLENQEKEYITGNDILNSKLKGLWKDRNDIKDSTTFARKLRKKAQRQ